MKAAAGRICKNAGAGKAGACVNPLLELDQGHQLAFGHPMQVDKLGQHTVNALG